MPNSKTIEPKYVIDTNVVLDFWGSIPEQIRNYDVEVKAFRAIWDFIVNKIIDGTILMPSAVADELSFTVKDELKEWLEQNKEIFVKHDKCIAELGEIVSKYESYTKSKSQLADAIVVAVAKYQKLTVITSERKKTTVSIKNPYIPNVCDYFKVKSIKVADFLIEEKQ